MKQIIEFSDFTKIDIRAGEIISVRNNEKARNPAYIMEIDFGPEYGIKGTSAQICANYTIDELIGKQVSAIMNFEPKRVAGFKSEVLVLAVVCKRNGTVLIRPDKPIDNGEKVA